MQRGGFERRLAHEQPGGAAGGGFADEVEAGRLVCPFDCRLRPAKAYHLLTRPGARHRPEIAAVCDWLRAEARVDAGRWPGMHP